MEGFLLFVHVFVCFLLVVVVLLQSGKQADLAGAFGGFGSQSTFGPRSAATFLSKMTTTLAVLFMVTSLLLWIISARKSDFAGSVFGKEDVKQEQKVDQQEGGVAEDENRPAEETDTPELEEPEQD